MWSSSEPYVERVWKVFPHAQVTVIMWYLGCMFAFTGRPSRLASSLNFESSCGGDATHKHAREHDTDVHSFGQALVYSNVK